MVVVPNQSSSSHSSPTDQTTTLKKNQIKDKSMSKLSSDRSNLLMPNSSSSALSIQNPAALQTSAVPIYIGNLSNEVHESHLHGFVSDIGIQIMSARICRNNETKKSLNYGYINFHSQEDADLAIKKLNYTPLLNRPVRMMPCQRDPTQRKLGKGNIVVKNLPMSVTHRLLYDTLTQIGTVQSIALKPDPSGGQTTQNAFVQFDDESLANQAVELLNNSKIEGSTMLVAVFKPQKEQFEKQNMNEDTFVNCYVKNLPKHQFTTDEDLRKLFERFGEITSCKLAIDYNGQPTGAGFVCFKNHESAKLAVEEGSKIMFDHKSSSTAAESSGDNNLLNSNEKNDGTVQEKDEKEAASKDVDGVQSSGDSSSQSKPLFVTRFQRKNERNQVLKDKFENLRVSASSSSSGTVASSKYDASGNAMLDETRTISPEMNTINNVYIKNLHPSVTDKILHEEFSKFGTIISAKVMMQPNQISRGFGFVSFQTPKQAENAIAHMHGTYFYTKPLHCELAQKKAERLVNLRNQFRAYSNVASAYGSLPGLGIGASGTYNGPNSAFNASALASHGHNVPSGPGNIQYFMKSPASATPFYAAGGPNFMSYSHQPNYSPYYSHLHQQQRQQHGHHMDPQSYFYSSNRFNSPSNSTTQQNMMHNSHNMSSSNPSGSSMQTNPIGTSASSISSSANSMANYQMQQSTGRMGASSNANALTSQHADSTHHNQNHSYKYNKSARNYNNSNNSSVSAQNSSTNQSNGTSQLTSEEKEHFAPILLNRLAKSPHAAHKKYAKMIASAVVEMKSHLAKEIIEYEDKKFYETSEKIYQHFINETR